MNPAVTDPKLDRSDASHAAYLAPDGKLRNQLVLFMAGTNGTGLGALYFCTTAAEQGYHVVNVTYPSNVPATSARNDASPDAMANFRWEIIEGGDKSPYVQVDRTNSIENRTIKLLTHLQRIRPQEKWSQFLSSPDQIDWSKIVVAGHSQGAGHAAIIAIKHETARVVMTGGPKDYDRRQGKPAAWYTAPKTPINRFFNFNHLQDKQGCDMKEQLEICRLMGMDKGGEPVNVDETAAPFKGSRILTTNYPGTTLTSTAAHVSVISDATTPRKPGGGLLFKPVWEYMLTTPVE